MAFKLFTECQTSQQHDDAYNKLQLVDCSSDVVWSIVKTHFVFKSLRYIYKIQMVFFVEAFKTFNLLLLGKLLWPQWSLLAGIFKYISMIVYTIVLL